MQASAVPSGAELARGDRDRREGRGRLRLEEAKTLAELRRDKVAQRNIISKDDQGNRRGGLGAIRAHRDIVDDDRDFPLEIDTETFIRHSYRLPGSKKSVRSALIKQGFGPKVQRHRGAARLAHELHVIQVGGAVDPLERARQWRKRVVLTESLAWHRAGFKRRRERFEFWREPRPIVERVL